MAPSGSIGMLLILKFVKEDRRAMTDARPDIPGAALIMVSMSLIIGGLVQSRPWGWSDPRVILGIILGGVFIVYLVQRSRNREFPILDLSLFKFATFRSSNVGTLVFGTGFFIVFFGYVLFLTDVWNYSARDAGILLTPLALCGAIMAPVTARFLRTHGTQTLLIPGGALFTAGALIMFFAAGDEPNILGVWLPSILLTGIGSGVAWPCLYAGVVAEVSANQYAAASGLNQTIQRMSTALGVAIAAVLLGDTVGQTSVGHFDRIFIASGLCGAAAATSAALLAQKPRAKK
jgi:Na+/melibiose symporter-like transporter